jgi:Fe-S cluster biogenesis protein NfuA
MEILEKADILLRVEQALETMRDFLRADGGDVELIDVDEDMTVQIRLLGPCKSCSMSIMTMKAGIEEAVRKAIPEIKAVVAVEEKTVVGSR